MESKPTIRAIVVLDSVKSQRSFKEYNKAIQTQFHNETVDCLGIGEEVGDWQFVTDYKGRSVWIRRDKILKIVWLE